MGSQVPSEKFVLHVAGYEMPYDFSVKDMRIIIASHRLCPSR